MWLQAPNKSGDEPSCRSAETPKRHLSAIHAAPPAHIKEHRDGGLRRNNPNDNFKWIR